MNKATIRRKLRVLQALARPTQKQIEEQAHLEQILKGKTIEENPLLATPIPQNFLDKPYIESEWS